jgi:hypothetical protein
MGTARPKTARKVVNAVKRAHIYVVGAVASLALLLVGNASAATSVTAPTLDPGAYFKGIVDAFSANQTALFIAAGVLAGVGAVIGVMRKLGRLRTR